MNIPKKNLIEIYEFLSDAHHESFKRNIAGRLMNELSDYLYGGKEAAHD